MGPEYLQQSVLDEYAEQPVAESLENVAERHTPETTPDKFSESVATCVVTLTDSLAEPTTRKRRGSNLPLVGTPCLQKDLQGGASAKSQVISKNGDLFIKQVDFELYKATGKVK